MSALSLNTEIARRMDARSTCADTQDSAFSEAV